MGTSRDMDASTAAGNSEGLCLGASAASAIQSPEVERGLWARPHLLGRRRAGRGAARGRAILLPRRVDSFFLAGVR